MSNVVTVAYEGDFAIISLNNPPVNASSGALRQALEAAIQEVEKAAPKAAILHGVGRVFMAGGDISEFGKAPILPHLPDVYQQIEDAKTPMIAAIHGMALGGGFELALACDFRIAAKGTKFALPEVNVGIIPGAGGTQRAPRLIGAEDAAKMASTGAMMDAARLNELGGLDMLVDGDVLEAAKTFAATLPAVPTPVSQREIAAVADGFFDDLRSATKKKAKGQKSPIHNIDAVEFATKMPFSEGQPKERALHMALRDTAESRALRHVFFAERAVAKPAAIAGATPRDIAKITVVGGGLMGAGIAFAALQTGLKVQLIERDDEAASAGVARIHGLIEGGVKRGKINADKAETLRQSVTGSSDYAASADSDLAIEAVFEDLDVKRTVFQSLAAHMSKDAILATNTSYLDPEKIMEGIENPSRLIGLHFFSPAHIMKLLEIVKLPQTSADVIATGFALGKKMRKISVLSGICDGFIGNRILFSFRRAADYLILDGASPEEIDAAMREFGLPMGPIELQDLTGLQIAYANRRRLDASRSKEERYSTIADQLVEMERTGQRVGKGWYLYDEGQRGPKSDPLVADIIRKEREKQGITPMSFTKEDIQSRLLAVMINEGARIVEEGIAERDVDIDMVKVNGYGFPKWRGGPMQYLSEVGLDKVKADMKKVADQSPNSWVISKRLS